MAGPEEQRRQAIIAAAFGVANEVELVGQAVLDDTPLAGGGAELAAVQAVLRGVLLDQDALSALVYGQNLAPDLVSELQTVAGQSGSITPGKDIVVVVLNSLRLHLGPGSLSREDWDRLLASLRA